METSTVNSLDELFAEMRFNIEGDLIDLAKQFDLPTCPSQRLRALRAVDAINELPPKEVFKRKLMRVRDRLEDFLAVHRTVTILERRERHQTEALWS